MKGIIVIGIIILILLAILLIKFNTDNRNANQYEVPEMSENQVYETSENQVYDTSEYPVYETSEYEFQCVKGLQQKKGMNKVFMFINSNNKVVLSTNTSETMLTEKTLEQIVDSNIALQEQQERTNITKTKLEINGLVAYKITFESPVKKFINTFIQKDSTLFLIDSDFENGNEELYNIVEKSFKVK